MLKKILILLFLFIICPAVWAENCKNIKYKNLNNGTKIQALPKSGWISGAKNKESDYYTIKGSEIYTKENAFLSDTDCSYIFIRKNSLIGYSDKLFKFFEFIPDGNDITKRELLADEVSEIFAGYKIIKLSDFSQNTNSYKFKKNNSKMSILVLNDKNYDMSGYYFSTNNAQFNKYTLNNILEVTKSGMIQLSHNGENSDLTPWFVLLVR